ncbi:MULTISPECIES: energy-coupling factor ABC transporter permease [Clostridium]|uniref:Cobalt transport protein CbiM n=1 Tax=Clostridium senegalense TaxID=1465809 RepID=A0A6M0H690_9CLOT|nr:MULTISPECIES: energy-coupling factor ABC transporter permease [Clostridium]NEU06235.1 energy-coupling factor ABC transporter permease [Clostridium senegalense]
MRKKHTLLLALFLCLFIPYTASAMHIAEGFLSPGWCITYFVLCIPFVIIGIKQIKTKTSTNKDLKMLLALVAAFCFVISALKLPSVSGSSSHATGTALGALIFGPFAMSVVGSLVLLFQALLLAHGGLTTLGANVFSMGIVGPFVSFFIYKIFKNSNKKVAIFLAAFLGDLSTYLITSIQMALAHSGSGSVIAAFGKFFAIFAVTQIPLAIVEGIFTVIIFEFIEKHSKEELHTLEEMI